MNNDFVAFDIDGVLADWTFAFTLLASSRYRMEAISTGCMLRYAGIPLSTSEKAEVWRETERTIGWWKSLTPLASPGDIHAMRVLAKQRRVMYISNRHNTDSLRDQTLLWLKDYDFPQGDLILTRDKPTTINALTNSGYLPYPKMLGIIEDSPYNLEAFRQAGLPAFVRDWPYNRDSAPTLPRVSSVAEFCTLMAPQ